MQHPKPDDTPQRADPQGIALLLHASYDPRQLIGDKIFNNAEVTQCILGSH